MKNNLKKLRLRQKMTQSHLAALLKCSVRTVRRYERGETRIPGEILLVLSRIFGVSPIEIYEEG